MKYKEYVLSRPGKIVTRESILQNIAEDEILIKVDRFGLCGSDIHLYNGTYAGPHSYPMLIGHEWSGQIVEIGSKVKEFSVGDLVTGDCSKYCGKCNLCGIDKNLCENIEKFGITIDGASSEYIVRNQKYVYKTDGTIPLDTLCLSEPFAVSAHLIDRIKSIVKTFESLKVLVLGGGIIGASSALLLKFTENVNDVVLNDLSSYRKNTMESLGIAIAREGDLKVVDSDSYGDLYNKTKFDIIIDTTGSPQAFSSALEIVRPNGVVGCLGMMSNVEIKQKLIVTKALTVVGSIGGTGYFKIAMDFLRKYPEKSRKLISHNYNIESNVDEAFETAMDANNSMKVTISI